MTAAIEVAGLRKNYGQHVALRGIDLRVEPGEVYGFIGPNGAGKTTTMRILLDILRPTAGSVRVLGEDPRVGGAGLRARIGYLPGELRLDGRYDVATLLDHYARMSHVSGGPASTPAGRASRAGRAHHPGDSSWRPLAERLGLDPGRQVRGLSKGNKQKVGLVQAFQHRPEVLILDEPTSGLDPLVQAKFLAMVREASAAGQTVFLSSHVLSEIEQAADRVSVLRLGEVVRTARVADLRASLGLGVRVLVAHPDAASVKAEFLAIPGVRAADARAERLDGRSATRLSVTLDGSAPGAVDAVVKAAARHRVLDLDGERPDLEEAVMRLYSSNPGAPQSRPVEHDVPPPGTPGAGGRTNDAPTNGVPMNDLPPEATR
ncbi:MAG: ABC transporter ATP-binding protein [Austwickia sp.]|jgi:ABC-2 type transport system ATP-binding protein|nr:MAG: ABC transporter ATP-binding protein [Austwickia sp.]